MDNNTNYTPDLEENLLNITDKNQVNLYESLGVGRAEILVQSFDETIEFNVNLILSIHRIAFEELYSWAGKWRTIEVQVGQLMPPKPFQVPNLMYQYADDINFRLKLIDNKKDLSNLLAYLHHRFVWIHPFQNGNGRTARIILNMVAMLKGYSPIQLYHREGAARIEYITALRKADKGDYERLEKLIYNELSAL